MTRTITVAPVRKTLLVNATQERAFEVFTRSISKWWPPSHTILKAPLSETLIEPRVGGRWYQIGTDGSQCGIGDVLAWEPPQRLLLSWRLNPDWQFDPNLTTEVELRFVAEGPKRTRVEFEHRHLERMGEKAQTTRASIDSPGGWTAILEAYRATAEA